MSNLTLMENEIKAEQTCTDIILGNQAVTDIVAVVKNMPVMKQEDKQFLAEHKEHLGAVMQHTHMWRTDVQKLSIINDMHFPTTHAKFHQAILEQKVQFDQAMYLAKDFELKKLEIEELQCDLEDLDLDVKRDEIKSRKLQVEIAFKQYELKNMQIAMDYRMREVKGWQAIEEELLKAMRENGVSDEEIWTKSALEIESHFFQTLNNLPSLTKAVDSAERSNLVSLALHGYQMAKEAGVLEQFRSKCNHIQLHWLQFIENELLNQRR